MKKKIITFILLLCIILNLIQSSSFTHTTVYADPIIPQVGSYITFGTNNTSPIKWQIISISGNRLTLFSADDIGEAQHSTDGKWVGGTNEKWLNEGFYNNAFTAREKTLIQQTDITTYMNGSATVSSEKVYLPSVVDAAGSYNANSAKLKDDKYKRSGTYFYRDSGMYGGSLLPYFFNTNGSIYFSGIGTKYCTYPVINIDSSAIDFSGLGTVDSPFYVSSIPAIGELVSPEATLNGERLKLTVPIITQNDATISSQGWQYCATDSANANDWIAFNSEEKTFSVSENGYFIRYFLNYSLAGVSNTLYSNSVQIQINKIPCDLMGVSVIPYTGVFDNTEHAAVAIHGIQAGDLITYSINGTDFSAECPQYRNAGTYPIYVKVMRAGYSDFTSDWLNVVINKKVLTDEMVSADPSQKYTGQPLTPMPVVTCDNTILIKDTDYTVNYQNNIKEGIATILISGTGNYSGEVNKKFAIYSKNTDVMITDAQAPKITVGGLDTLYDDTAIYTEQDKKIEQNGGSVKIEMSVRSAQNVKEDKEKIAQMFAKKDIGLYFDLSLVKKIITAGSQSESSSPIRHTNQLLTVVIPIPDNVKQKSGIAIFRVHEGVSAEIPSGIENAVNGEYCIIGKDTITLNVNNFSTYAIGFDKETKADQETNTDPKTKFDIDAKLIGNQGENGWYKGDSLKLQAPDGYLISRTSQEDSDWSDSIAIDKGGKYDQFTYYLRLKSDTKISGMKEISFQYDNSNPEIEKDSIEYTTLNHGIISTIGRFLSFGNYFKESVQVTLNVKDLGESGADKLYYQSAEIGYSDSCSVINGKAVFELPLAKLKDQKFKITMYTTDVAGNESEKMSLQGNGNNSDSWYFSDENAVIGDFQSNGKAITDNQSVDELMVTLSSAIHQDSGIYKISYKFDQFTDYTDVKEQFGASGVIVKDYNFKQIFNSPGSHSLQLKVESNAGEISEKSIKFDMPIQKNARQITLTALGSSYFEGEEIKLSDLKYRISGLSQNENANEVFDFSNIKTVIDGKVISGDSVTLSKGIHSVSFIDVYSPVCTVNYVAAELNIFEKYTVTFDGNGGKTEQDSVSAQNDQLLNVPKEPTKPGCGFVGWSLKPDGSALWNFAYDKVNSDMTLYAIWSDKNCTVTIRNNNDSEDLIYSSIPYGKKLNQPANPSLEGYSFLGWYQDSAYTKPWNFENDTLKENTTIYARFTKQTFTVSFAPTGAQTPPAITGIYYDQMVRPIPQVPVSDSKLFAGWYLDKELTQPFDFAFDTVKDNIFLYPKWVDKTHSILGGVTDSLGKQIENAKVELLCNGTKIAEATTDKNGLFHFVQVPNGEYSIVASVNTKNTSQNVTIKGKDIDQLVISMPDKEIKKAVVSSSNANHISVDNIENILSESDSKALSVMDQRVLRDGGKMDVQVLVSEQDKMPEENISALKEFAESQGKLTADFCAITIEKSLFDNKGNCEKGYISETEKAVMIKIPLSEETKNRNHYEVIREHNGKMQTLTTEPVNGEYFELIGNDIVIHTKAFSDFAISFDRTYTPNWAWLLITTPILLLLGLFYVNNKTKKLEKGR